MISNNFFSHIIVLRYIVKRPGVFMGNPKPPKMNKLNLRRYIEPRGTTPKEGEGISAEECARDCTKGITTEEDAENCAEEHIEKPIATELAEEFTTPA